METVLALPFPPSVNRIWQHNRRTGQVYLAERYKVWKRVADSMFLTQKRDCKPIAGRFTAFITLDASRQGRSDLDNRIKVLLDFLQRVEVIENDKLCDGLTVRWGTAKEGCTVRLRPSREHRRAA